MIVRPIIGFFFSFIFLLSSPFKGKSQVTLALSKRNLTIEKVALLFENRQFELAKTELDDLLLQPNINAILSEGELENLQYMQVVCGLNQKSFASVQDAIAFLKKSSSKSRVSILAFYLSQYFFDLSRFDEALTYLELTGDLFLSNEQAEQVQFQKGVAYFSQKKFDNASPYFKSLLQLKSSTYNDDVAYYLGFISFAEKKYTEALGLFTSIKESNAYKYTIPFYLSFINHELGNSTIAIKFAEEYLKGNDKAHLVEMLQLMGSLYFNAGNSTKVVDVYEQLISKGIVLNNIQKFELGTSYFQTSKYNKAIQQLNPLSSKMDSIGLNAMYILAQSYLGVNQKANARNSFGFCISGKISEPKMELAQFYYSKLSFELGFEDLAMSELASFLINYPSSKYLAEANNIMFSHYAKTNNFKKAISLLSASNTIAVIDPAIKARVYYGRGMELINELAYKQADEMMKIAYQQKDRSYSGPSIFWRGELAYRSEQYDQAINFFSNYLNLGSVALGEANEGNALYSIGYAYFEKEEYKKALSYFEKIKQGSLEEKNDIKGEVQVLIADCYFMLKNIQKAKSLYTSIYQHGSDGADYALFQLSLIEGIKSLQGKISLLKEAEKKYPNSDYRPLIYMELADTYLSEEQFESAIPYLQQIPQLVDKDDEMIPDAMLKLGIAYYNTDQTQLALDRFKALISAYPSTPQAGEALENAKILFVEKGKLEDYETFLQGSGKSLTSIEKDSLRYQVIQTAIAGADITLARKAMNQYLAEFPTGLFAIEVQHLLSDIYVDEKDWLNAARSYANLAERGSSKYQEKALRQAARIYFFELKDYRRAAALFQQLNNSATKDEIILEALRGEVRSHYYLKEWMAGLRSAEQLVANSKATQDDIAFASIILGYFAQANKEYLKSTAYFKTVISGNQSVLAAEARYQFAWNTVEQGDLVEAESLATKAIESSGSNEYWITKSYILLGKIFLQQKDYFNAKATLKSVIDNVATIDLKKEAEDLLLVVESAEKISK